MSYSLDTSGFLDAWVRHYPIDVFPTIWDRLDSAIKEGKLMASEEVMRELERKDDEASAWMKARPSMIVPFSAEIESEVIKLMGRFPRLVDTKKGRSGGDPFVIAVAITGGHTVITGENATGKLDAPRIPDVCKELQIPCIKMLDFFREQRWNL
jgi:Domain of unknown function (DUF4411)